MTVIAMNYYSARFWAYIIVGPLLVVALAVFLWRLGRVGKSDDES